MPDDAPIEAAGEGDAEVADGAPPTALGPDDPTLREIVARLDSVEYVVSSGQDVLIVDAAELATIAKEFKDSGFELLADVTAVDYLGGRRVRFEVVVNLVSVQHSSRIRIRTAVPADAPSVPSLVPIYPGANFFEREVFDMFGISFTGHPDMTRILMPDDWEGYPLRKDFSTGAVPVQFKEANKVN